VFLKVLESMLMRVVDSMVQLAASDDDLRGELNAPDKNGMCLLHYAGLYNILPLVPVLLQYGAWVDATAGEQLQTPLHLAAGAGHAAVVGSLLLHGADPFCKDALGHDAVAVASYHVITNREITIQPHTHTCTYSLYIHAYTCTINCSSVES
jgi:hypothetical protein